MKIVIIGPGLMPIPPKGWGAVEILIWEYYIHLKQYGIDAYIVNKPSQLEIIQDVNSIKPDIIHIQYDDWFFLWDSFECKKVIITNHYAYMTCPNRINKRIVDGIVNSKLIIHCLSKEINDVYLSLGVDSKRMFVLSNGGNDATFKYSLNPSRADKAIYLAKIDFRKHQYVYQNIPEIDFVGNLSDGRFNPNRSNYLGEWDKSTLYNNLSEYSTLVLLSDGEAHPLVCCEALICGLGLVVSTYASANLDISKPFIIVIPDEKLNDIHYVKNEIKKNIEISKNLRDEIRDYGIKMFSWNNVVKRYIDIIQEINN
jgi:glycosyltransferase involved in cell wall biosynthesis